MSIPDTVYHYLGLFVAPLDFKSLVTIFLIIVSLFYLCIYIKTSGIILINIFILLGTVIGNIPMGLMALYSGVIQL
jgi:hypothetical protein